MVFCKAVVVLMASFLLYIVDSRAGIAGNIKLVAMNGNQYWFSSSSPYAPNLNSHLAYQYCRTLGLQLVVLETKEEVDTISAYLNSFEVGSIMNRNNYWTSGNRLGANSWLWMSSGEQLNGSSFSEFPLLKQADSGLISANSKNCLSMKSTVAKRAIFTPDECEKALPFICEQVRCLYYNYPVAQFPDPNDLRSDLEEGVGVTQSESESRASLNYIPSDKLRSQNFISSSSSQRNANTLRLAQIAFQDKRKTDPSKIQRRITLRPVPPTFPYTSDYVNSFYKYQSIDYSATSTDRPTFKKTTRESLWSPYWPSSLNTSTTRSRASTTPIPTEEDEEVPCPLSTVQNPLLQKHTTRLPQQQHPLQNINSRRRAQLEIVKIKATERNGDGGVTTIQPSSSEDSTGRTVEVIYSRRGPGFRSPTSSNEGYSETTTVDPNKIVFDDEENNVGGEIEDIVEDVVIKDTTTEPGVTEPMFFQGNGIRQPDTKSFLTTIGIPVNKGSSWRRSSRSNESQDREISQTQTPTTLKQMFQYQRSKSAVSWASRNKNSKNINNSSNAGSRRSRSSSVSVIANTGPAKIALGPRLKFRTKAAVSHS
ncbi:Perlucin [Orchesella cincta]|uniref:Perlucin n=1 Tax=Orchesella cincta TaxID=48709 RepID=A0A1D2N1Y2_ORCCI|nr:Perlucin [Orchesella cincta]